MAPVIEFLGRNDPLGLAPATVTVLQRALANPMAMMHAYARLSQGMVQLQVASTAKALGVRTDPVLAPEATDRRFKERTWEDNPAFFALQQSYLLACRFAEDVLEAGSSGDADDLDDRKAAFLVRLVTESLSPTNFAGTNPEAMIRAFQTGGQSLVQGASNMLEDYVKRGGMPEQVDASGFALGENLAATPGKVVFRNDLIELIQYAPQTDQVHEVPILCSPPWINKFYVMDLAPDRSLVEWMVGHGRTVFMISYRDPGVELGHLTMDDYLRQGVLSALDVVEEITGSPKVDLVGLCLGGAMATMAVASLAAGGDERVNSLTTLNTLIDYSEPGELGIFTDAETLRRVRDRMLERGGVLPASDMARTFDLLRARDLVFRYVPGRWLMGEKSPAFDVLVWNADSVRMPATMHTEYLEALYGQNRLARGDYELGGQQLDLKDVTVDSYVVGAINDHIVPWTSSFAVTGLTGGKVRYVLSNGGHIAGVVNPPGPKAWYEALPAGKDSTTGTPESWRASATRTAGTWWEDWTRWSTKRAGTMVDPPPLGSEKHPALTDAPGDYVR
ncbi:alpha/beta fold hydrolase [Ornithinimicrobium avium]|uniref:Alpha/beta fold hydrolase n=2 Tax=Ornithinimicrobium avium TaxID=2283195 RepID=A0A345NSF9_9MICO|nr:alpha/beta fold hydrolase [Ornithinimicrobium avium]